MSCSANVEAILRQAFGDAGGIVVAGELIDRLVVMGYTRLHGASMISSAVSVGLLQRQGARRPYSYRIDTTYSRRAYLADQARMREERAGRQPSADVKASDGLNLPAFGDGDLAPHLGTPVGDDDDLPPVVGHAYRDTTRRIYERAFQAVE